MATAPEPLLRKRQDIETELVRKANADPAFREALISDPKGTIEKEAGLRFRPEVSVHVHVETPTDMHLSLPAQVSPELSERELEAVVGGGDFNPQPEPPARLSFKYQGYFLLNN